jgi:hypothetical protein
MNATLIKWLAAIIMAMVFATSFAEEFLDKPKEKFIGKWDNHAGIISFLLKNMDGKKQVRMLVAGEHLEGSSSKLSIDMPPDELDEIADLVDTAVKKMDDADTLPIPPLGTREIGTPIGSIIYANCKLTFSTVDPAGTKRYIAMIFKTSNKTSQYVFWLEKEDLVLLKKLIDKTLLALE